MEQLKDLKKHLFELSVKLDELSVKKDYEALRKLHYSNIKWISEHGLQEEYYDVFFKEVIQNDNSERDS